MNREEIKKGKGNLLFRFGRDIIERIVENANKSLVLDSTGNDI